jgi:hypothetical protein
MDMDKSLIGCTITITFDPDTDPDSSNADMKVTFFEHEWKHAKCASEAYSLLKNKLNTINNKCCRTGTKAFEHVTALMKEVEQRCNASVGCADRKNSTNPARRAEGEMYCKRITEIDKLIRETTTKLEKSLEGDCVEHE